MASGRAVVRELETRFASWENLRDAPIAAIEEAIRPITFPEQKAVHLKRALEQITASTKNHPRCSACPLLDICAAGQTSRRVRADE